MQENKLLLSNKVCVNIYCTVYMKHILHVHIQLLEWNEKSYKTSSLHKRSFPEMLDDTEYPLKQYIVFF